MKNSERISVAAKIAVLTLGLIIIQSIGALFIPALDEAHGTAESQSQASITFLALVVGISFLQTTALAYPILRSRWRGWRLVAVTFVLFFGTVTFLNQIESVLYLRDSMPPGMLVGIFAMGLFNAALFSPIAVVVLGKWRSGDKKRDEAAPATSATAPWKIAVASFVYLACYYLFGYYIAWQSPAVRAHYGGTDPGSFMAQIVNVATATPWMIPLQYFRGLLWVLLGLLVIRMMRRRWWEAGLAVSVLFTVPILYLLYPNPVMPDAVRYAHLTETVPYQFLFGWFLAWFFSPGSRLSHGVAGQRVPADNLSAVAGVGTEASEPPPM